MLKPKQKLTEADIAKGLRLIIGDGLMAEVVIAFTGGAILVALALELGASNVQIGLLAALPTITNVFQLGSVWIVRYTSNRRIVTVFGSILARLPLLAIGVVPFFAEENTGINLLIIFLLFHYFFSSIAGPSWNSWMKDLVPEHSLGVYFSKRSSYTQALNILLSIVAALLVDYIRSSSPEYLAETYGFLFIVAGLAGLGGAIILACVPEPQIAMEDEAILSLVVKPLRDGNFQRLMFFNCAWAFATNIGMPFFAVFMLKTLNLSLSVVIGLSIVSQLAGLLTVRQWGGFADRYSNKTIIAISAPLYILSLAAWCFLRPTSPVYINIVALTAIYVITGVANAGINISITNLGLKLSPKNDAIVYLSVRSMLLSLFTSVSPLVGGVMADYFVNRSLLLNVVWGVSDVQRVFHIVTLENWKFLFVTSALLSLVALELLVHVKERGEVERDLVVRIMRTTLRSSLRDFFIIGTLIGWHEQLWELIRRKLTWKLLD
jgi:MFS family permease